jgi:hypothetical protein
MVRQWMHLMRNEKGPRKGRMRAGNAGIIMEEISRAPYLMRLKHWSRASEVEIE